MPRELTPVQMIERSIQKKYRKELWTPFILAVKRYALIQSGDRVAVCVSGGKDSMLLAKLIQLLQRYSDVPCMKMTKQKGGYSIAVHAPGATEAADDMLLQGRVDFSVEADYTPDSEIEQVVTMLMRRIRASHELTLRHAEQVQRAHRRRGKYVPLDIPMRGGLEDGEDVE